MKKENPWPLFAVIGRPVFHSRSPELYNQAFQQKKIRASYIRLASSCLEEALTMVKELDMAGFNLTAPYKEKILSYLDEVDEQARSIAAVNTVLRTENKLKGFNTDPEGFRWAVKRAGIELNLAKVLVLGAGGAARAVLYALKQAGARTVWVSNRSEEKAQKLASAFGYSFLSLQELRKSLPDFSLVVSCLPRLEYLLSFSDIPRGCRLIEASYLPLAENSAVSAMEREPRRIYEAKEYETKENKELSKQNWPERKLTRFLATDRGNQTDHEPRSGEEREKRSRIQSENCLAPLRTPHEVNGTKKSGLEWLLGQGVAAFRLFTGEELKPEEIVALRESVFRGRPKKNNLAVIGFMGCGKSAVARLLAAKLGWNFLDTDDQIEIHSGQTIEAIFAKQGEAGFRKIERQLIPEILLKAKQTVIALGGGAVLSTRVRQALASSCHVLWLWAPLEECLKRMSRSGKSRPLLRWRKSFASRERLLQERVRFYACSSDLLVANLDGNLEQTVGLIYEEISSSL